MNLLEAVNMQENNAYQYSGIAGIVGAISLLVGTSLHPSHADPNDPYAAFSEYAAHHDWVAVHLIQLLGIALMVVTLMALSKMMENGRGGMMAHLGTVGATTSLAIAAALQAVDGIALKLMVDRWANAPIANKDMLFYATVGVRQIEVGLASMLSLMLGSTAIIYGLAQRSDDNFPNGVSWLAIIGGLGTAAAGIAMSQTGFSNATMIINMPSNLLLLVWMVLTGIWMLKITSTSVASVMATKKDGA